MRTVELTRAAFADIEAIQTDRLVVLAVLHGAMDLPSQLKGRH